MLNSRIHRTRGFSLVELMVGLVQALVFMLLTAVFTLLICQHHEEGPGTAHA